MKRNKIKTAGRFMLTTKAGAVGTILIALMVIGVSANIFNYYVEKTYNVSTPYIIEWDGNDVESLQEAYNLSLGPGESYLEEHTMMYHGALDNYTIQIACSNGFEGIHTTLYRNDVELSGNTICLEKDVEYDIDIKFDATLNLSQGNHAFVLTIEPFMG